ncbi:MAG TPA: hypothetical protein G4N94_08080 [Caldilineae bacterium]|nr:hypothetical protein [Caldilineae bacterium]
MNTENVKTQFLRRLPFLALSILALLAGMWAGVIRMGWMWPPLQPTLPMDHGPLMVAGFMGTLITLERSVALEFMVQGWLKKLVYLPPLLSGIGGLLILFGVQNWVGPLLMVLGGIGLVAMLLKIYFLHPVLHSAIIALGAVMLTVGNLLWLFGQPVPNVVLWWAGFLIMTIAGERLELSRLLVLSTTSRRLFLAATILFTGALVISHIDYALGVRLAGAGMVALALWLLRYDIAWRRIKAGGQARYISLSLLSGNVWLAIGGVLAIVYGGATSGLGYDAMLHSIFLGFTFTMIFAHAPIIFPVVLKVPSTYTPWFYSHLILLHISLILRVVGDLAAIGWMRQWGGLLNAIVLLLFLFNTIMSPKLARKKA